MGYDFNDHDRQRIEAQREVHDAIGLCIAGAIVALLALLLLDRMGVVSWMG